MVISGIKKKRGWKMEQHKKHSQDKSHGEDAI